MTAGGSRGAAWGGLVLALLCSAALMVLFAALAVVGGGAPSAAYGEDGAVAASALAVRQIPARYLRLYQLAGERFGLDWAVIAGIGRVECDHGLDPAPSCLREGVVNSAGAGGPMQFLASTWARYGIDGDGDGRADRWDPADAIFSAANYLRASGAPGDYRRALFAYNHASWYVQQVLAWAARYSGQSSVGSSAQFGEPAQAASAVLQSQTGTAVLTIPGAVASLDPADRHLALIPAEAPPVVQAMLVAGNELQRLPYGPAGHPDPRGAPQEDCSSTVNYVLYRSGVRPIAEILRDNPLAQDYVSWGAPGPGRWVTIYATVSPTPHVFIVIAGLRLDTSFDGTDVGPNRHEAGPRWRILPGIPTWARWSVRHPPGL